MDPGDLIEIMKDSMIFSSLDSPGYDTLSAQEFAVVVASYMRNNVSFAYVVSRDKIGWIFQFSRNRTICR